MWKICIDRPFQNCELIFPTKQKYVRKIIDIYSGDPEILSITVFGSAVTSACNPWSDIDLYVEMAREKKRPRALLEIKSEVDLWTNFSVDDRLLQEIRKTGVVVYSHP